MFSHKKIISSAVLCLTIVLSACTLPTPTPVLGDPPRRMELYVSTSGNDSNNCLSEATACLTLYWALRMSTPGSVIHIGPGEFRREAGGEANSRHDITIIGAGVDQTTLTSYSSRVFQLTNPVRVEIRDLTMAGEGPGVDGLGGTGKGIEVRAGQVVLENCRIRVFYYGLDVWQEASATVRNCTFENNYYAVGNRGNLTLTDSTITGNILGLTNGGVAQVENTAFDRNGNFDSASGASATAVTNYEGELTIRGGSISNTRGYAFINQGGVVTIEGVAIRNNAGVAVWHTQGLTTILSSVIADNGVYGVAIGGRSDVTDIGRVTISQSAIVRNGSSGVRMDGGEVHIQNTTISGNVASTSGGGGIWGYGGNLFLLDSTVAYNTGKGLELGPGGSRGPASITIRRSVVALNSGAECQLDPSTAFSASIFATYVCNESWTTATLKLQALVEDAGTFVHPIDADSPLVNSGGTTSTCPGVDQRNFPRPAGSSCDVGAYEYGSASAAIVIATPETSGIIPLVTDTPMTAPELASFILVIQVPANCRQGPGTVYPVVNSALPGEQVQVIGKSADGTWWYSQVDNDKCFISNIAGYPTGDLSLLTVIPDPPKPLPTEPSAPEEKPIPEDKPAPTDEVIVEPDYDGDGYPASTDCNDKDPKINPGAVEMLYDKVDSNCNGDINK